MSVLIGGNSPYWTCLVEDAEDTQERNSYDDLGSLRNLGGLADGVVVFIPSEWENVETCNFTIYGALSDAGAYNVELATGSITDGVVKTVFFGQSLAITPLPFMYLLLNIEPAEGEVCNATVTAYIINNSL